MRFAGSLLLAPCLAGCGEGPDIAPGSPQDGRYHGIGIYAPGPLWERLADVGRSGDPRSATLRDDDEIIVTVDSRTGEIRQCGNLSGHCIRMNPWSGQQAVPIGLTAHAVDLDAEDAANQALPAAKAR